MHNAPAVTYPVGRSLFEATLVGSIWLLGSAASLAWCVLATPSIWKVLVAGAISLMLGATSALNWWRRPTGTLSWEGDAWRCTLDRSGEAGSVQVSVDLQHGLLLRFRAPRASHWLWLERRARAERWDDLRRAVYSRARMEAPRDAKPPAGTS